MTGGARLLTAQNLTVRRGGVQVLEIPEFILNAGEVVSLIGPNGAGKSTLLLALAGLIPHSVGQLTYRGEVLDTDRALFTYRRRLAMVFQEPLLFDGTVFDNVAAGLKIRKMSKDTVIGRVTETLALFSITHLAERSARKLSGGEAQRVSLARAFAIQPEVIFLDEPFGALDPPTRQGLMEDLDRILADTSTAAVLTTHDQLEALRLSDRMLVVNQGRIVQSGTPAEVMNQPCTEFVASFVGMENVLTGQVCKSQAGAIALELAGKKIECLGVGIPGESAVICIRPEHITIETVYQLGESSARNIFQATIRKIIAHGGSQKIYLDCGFPLVVSLTSQSVNNMHLEVGKQVFASFKATSVHLMRCGI
jgi:tungstate transport system ATP-binding protein